jgi:hypothetical protein
MAKTLVGLFYTLVEAERVVIDLIEHDFVRIAMRQMTHDVQGQEADESYFRGALRTAEGGFIDELTEMGLPVDEAHSYAEGLRQGGVLVMVRASDATAEHGIALMNRQQAADGHACLVKLY